MRMTISVSSLAAGILLAATPTVAEPHHDHEDHGWLREFTHIVVIYQENHSFDNLYGLWGTVNGKTVNGLANADPAHTLQLRSDGATPYKCLLQNDVNLTSPSPLASTCSDSAGSSFQSAFVNAPFKIDDYISATDTTCAAPGASAPFGVSKGSGLPGGCTRDLVHRFYSEQYQINLGAQNRYVAASDGAGLSMGHYDTTKLPIYNYLHSPKAPNYVILDNFFQAAFGGSFLNHQWLVAANTPIFAGAVNDGGTSDFHSVVDSNGMPTNTPLYASPLGSAVKDLALTASCAPPANRPATPVNIACGDFAVNTIQPFYWPYAPGTADVKRLRPLANPTIGDRLSAANIDWAWYSGGWSNANGNIGAPGWTNGAGPTCSDPNANSSVGYPRCPDKLFQYHHHPFNYYANYAPGSAARADHLLDEVEFIQAARSGRLKQVSFVKPLGEDNEHPGYTDESDGSKHLVNLIDAIIGGPNGRDTLIIVCYDEFGGSWDHVPPPPHNYDKTAPHDVWGPGTRIPALLISKKFERSDVDHAAYDTTSILKLVEERFKLAPLGSRDAAIRSLGTALQKAAD